MIVVRSLLFLYLSNLVFSSVMATLWRDTASQTERLTVWLLGYICLFAGHAPSANQPDFGNTAIFPHFPCQTVLGCHCFVKSPDFDQLNNLILILQTKWSGNRNP